MYLLGVVIGLLARLPFSFLTGQSFRPGHMQHCMNPVGYPADKPIFVPRSPAGEDKMAKNNSGIDHGKEMP